MSSTKNKRTSCEEEEEEKKNCIYAHTYNQHRAQGFLWTPSGEHLSVASSRIPSSGLTDDLRGTRPKNESRDKSKKNGKRKKVKSKRINISIVSVHFLSLSLTLFLAPFYFSILFFYYFILFYFCIGGEDT